MRIWDQEGSFKKRSYMLPNNQITKEPPGPLASSYAPYIPSLYHSTGIALRI